MENNKNRFSLTISLIVIILLSVIGSYFFYAKNTGIKETETVLKTQLDSANKTERMRDLNSFKLTEITWDSTQVGDFNGYYETIKLDYFLSEETCNTLVILDGNNKLTEYFIDMALRGNTVQTVTSNGLLRLNLPWSEISEEDKIHITKSTIEAPITITLEKLVQGGKGAQPCHSFFKYVGIK